MRIDTHQESSPPPQDFGRLRTAKKSGIAGAKPSEGACRVKTTDVYGLTIRSEERARLLDAMKSYEHVDLPEGSKFAVIAAALVDNGDVYVARNHELAAPVGTSQHAEERLWGKMKDAGVRPKQVRWLALSSPQSKTPIFPCGGCRDFTSTWTEAGLLVLAGSPSQPALHAEVVMPLTALSPWSFHSSNMQTRAAAKASILSADHEVQPLIASAQAALCGSSVRVDRGMVPMAVAMQSTEGSVVASCSHQISGRITHACAAACALGVAQGIGKVNAVAVVNSEGLFAPPPGSDLDFLAASACDRKNLPVYLHNSKFEQTLVLKLGEMLPADPDLWGKNAPTVSREL